MFCKLKHKAIVLQTEAQCDVQYWW